MLANKTTAWIIAAAVEMTSYLTAFLLVSVWAILPVAKKQANVELLVLAASVGTVCGLITVCFTIARKTRQWPSPGSRINLGSAFLSTAFAVWCIQKVLLPAFFGIQMPMLQFLWGILTFVGVACLLTSDETSEKEMKYGNVA